MGTGGIIGLVVCVVCAIGLFFLFRYLYPNSP
jgi:hypothetical protein